MPSIGGYDRRNPRTQNKMVLKNLMAHRDIDDVNDEIFACKPMDLPGGLSEALASYGGTEQQYLKKCEDRWTQFPLLRARYKSKAIYLARMAKHYRLGLNK